MQYIDNIIFFIALIVGFGLFFKSLKEIYSNIQLGKKIERSKRPAERWAMMAKAASGQSKMTTRPIARSLDIIVYGGFVILKLVLFEIIIEGIFGAHRFLAGIIGDSAYAA